MMQNIALLDNRLKQILINDKKDNPIKIVGLIKSEIFYVLKNYMDIKLEDINLDIGIDNNGKYLITMSCEVARIFIANHLC